MEEVNEVAPLDSFPWLKPSVVKKIMEINEKIMDVGTLNFAVNFMVFQFGLWTLKFGGKNMWLYH